MKSSGWAKWKKYINICFEAVCGALFCMPFRNIFFQSLLHLFFPYTCCGCGSVLLTDDILFCFWCEEAMPVTGFEFHHNNPIEKIFFGRADIRVAAAHVYFTSGSIIQHSLHLLKYKNRKEIGLYFGQVIGTVLKKSGRFDHCELVIPLPLFKEREKKRGYNQSALIAEGIAMKLHIPVIKNAVKRRKKTETQTQKTRIERWKNLEFSFEITDPHRIEGKHILLVDDVITTGASLEACAHTLLSIPGVQVSISCLAYTVAS